MTVAAFTELQEEVRALDASVTVQQSLPDGTAVSDVPVAFALIEGPARAVLTC